MKFVTGTGILLAYMFPCLLVASVQLWDYYVRICDSEFNMHCYAPLARMLQHDFDDIDGTPGEMFIADGHLSKDERREIVRRFKVAQKEYQNAPDKQAWLNRLDTGLFLRTCCKKIWRENSAIVAIMVFLPFLLFGLRLAYDKRIECRAKERLRLAFENWPMKLIVAAVIGVGWMYLLNPYGRAATAFYQTYLLYSIPPVNTLPVFISIPEISHTISGFLGWYLNFLFYVFTKLYHNDVTSSRMYRFLFVKLLFTYGLAMVATPVFQSEGKLAVFLIGFFPVSAISSLKRVASKAMHHAESESDDLSSLPGMSTWTTLRLQEEGVTSITMLASLQMEEVSKYFPARITSLLRLWIDAARLHTAVGAAAYEHLKPVCRTASEFIDLSYSDDFAQSLKALTDIENASTVVARIRKTFPGDLFQDRGHPPDHRWTRHGTPTVAR